MAFSMSDTIDGVIKRDGPATNDPKDLGGRTQLGISENANPDAWKDGVVTAEEAQAIYTQKYVKSPHFDMIQDPHLFLQLVDTGVLSGPEIAIRKLQEILKVTVDGVLGPETLAALALQNPKVVNNQLVIARIRMICRIVQKAPAQIKFLCGWCDRALSFLV
jgi:type VI secretion system secreted protein VgrG